MSPLYILSNKGVDGYAAPQVDRGSTNETRKPPQVKKPAVVKSGRKISASKKETSAKKLRETPTKQLDKIAGERSRFVGVTKAVGTQTATPIRKNAAYYNRRPASQAKRG